MPGLIAVFRNTRDGPGPLPMEAMARAMWHEDFYRMDTCNGSTRPFAACRVHLNLPGREPQPFRNEDGTIQVMVDGELRSSDDVRNRLVSRGHRLRSNDPAEWLVHLYEDYGESLVDEIDGRFLALIDDSRTGTTLILNDRFGLYRAFYATCDGTFLVASEIKSLLKYDRRLAALNTEALGQYFLYDAVLDEGTLFKGVRRLPPASLWVYKAGKLSQKQYYDLAALDAHTEQSEQDFTEHAAQLLMHTVLADTRGADVAISVTGGWDSRAIIAVMMAAGCTAPCYTWCNPHRESLDVQMARRVAKAIGQELHVFTLGRDFFENFEDYARRITYISDGSADVFRSQELYFNQAVRRVAPIRVTGAYGTEIATRNPYFLRPQSIDRRILSEKFIADHGDIDRQIHTFDSMKSHLNGLRWLFPSGMYSLERSEVEVRWPYVNRALVELLLSAPQSYLAQSRVQKYIVRKYAEPLARIPSDKGAYIKGDSAVSNARLHLWASLVKMASLADNAYVHPNVPHVCTRVDPLMRYTGLERLVMGHRNLVAYRIWTKRALRKFFESTLLDERTLGRAHVNPGFLRQMTHDHFTNRGNYTREIGKIVSLELFHRAFLD